MRTHEKERKGFVNLLLVMLILLVYVCVPVSFSTVSAMGYLYPQEPVLNGRDRYRVVAMECVVSWDAVALEAILDCLAACETRITFFITGDWARRNPALIRQMQAQGHEIGVIGYNSTKEDDIRQMQSAMERTAAFLQEQTGTMPRLVFAGIHPEKDARNAAQAAGMRLVSCSVDLLCARGTKNDIVSRAVDAPFGGCIYLLEPTAAAVEALPEIIAGLQRQGYVFATVGEIV